MGKASQTEENVEYHWIVVFHLDIKSNCSRQFPKAFFIILAWHFICRVCILCRHSLTRSLTIMLPLVLIHPCTAFTLTYSTLVKWFLSLRFFLFSFTWFFAQLKSHTHVFTSTNKISKQTLFYSLRMHFCVSACMHACACVFGHFLFLILQYISCKLLNIFLNKKCARKMVFLVVSPENRERASGIVSVRGKRKIQTKKVQEKITEESGR